MAASKKPVSVSIPNAAETDKLITSIAKAGKKLDADIQRAALGALAQVGEHRNTTLVNRLYLSLSAGTRKAALTGWLLQFGSLVANDGDNKKEQPFKFNAEKATNMAGAQAQPWFDFAPDKDPDQVFDVVAALNSLLRKAGKATSNNSPELVAKLRELVPSDASDT